MLLTFIIWI